MKRLYVFSGIITVLILFASFGTSFGVERNSYFEFNGVVKQFLYDGKQGETIVDRAKIRIVSSDKIVLGTYYSSNTGKCHFRIPLFKNVIIEVTKENYVSKTLTVNTWVPDLNNSMFSIKYDIYLFENVDGLDVSVLKEPIANVVFENTLNSFNYDREYSNRINENLKKMYSEYYHDMGKYNSYATVSKNEYKNTSNVEKLTDSIAVEVTPAAPTPIAIPDITYEVQVLALKGPIPIDAPLFGSCGNVTMQFTDGFYKYTLGRVQKLEYAKQLLDSIVQLGFTDAFIVALKNNDRITIREAMDLQSRK